VSLGYTGGAQKLSVCLHQVEHHMTLGGVGAQSLREEQSELIGHRRPDFVTAGTNRGSDCGVNVRHTAAELICHLFHCLRDNACHGPPPTSMYRADRSGSIIRQ
jgi:hypothetical protein